MGTQDNKAVIAWPQLTSFYLDKELSPVCLNEFKSKIKRSCQGLGRCGHHFWVLVGQLHRAEEAQERIGRSLLSSDSSTAFRPHQAHPTKNWHNAGYQDKLNQLSSFIPTACQTGHTLKHGAESTQRCSASCKPIYAYMLSLHAVLVPHGGFVVSEPNDAPYLFLIFLCQEDRAVPVLNVTAIYWFPMGCKVNLLVSYN